jgi:hypothetical protein
MDRRPEGYGLYTKGTGFSLYMKTVKSVGLLPLRECILDNGHLFRDFLTESICGRVNHL